MSMGCGMQSSSLLRPSLSSKGVVCSSVGSVGDFGNLFAGERKRLGVRTSAHIVASRLPCVSITGEHCEVRRCSLRSARPPCAQTRASFSEAEAVTSPELDMVTPPEAEEELSQATLIWRAVKLPLYSVAVIPLTVGAAAAYLQSGLFFSGRYWLLLGSSVLVITWLNLSNDAYDAETGVDKDKKESVVNITGSQTGVLGAAYACLALGAMGIVKAAQRIGDMRVVGLLSAAILCGYVYQCPPFRLSYKGLGEPLCFVAFGPLATTAFYLCHASGVGALPVTLTVLGVSVLVGITTSLILFCSHFHQIEGDLAVGKMSPLVRLGTEKGSKVVQTAVISVYTIIALLTALKALPLTCFGLSLLTLPIGKLVLQFIGKNHAVRYTTIFRYSFRHC
ncbi:hypothetical protein M758_10G010800 [Ceratodon purpureus]|uniref:2-carboxy-1,4-naphthoquinone phytyltransferase, chloroplastic n=1 Tax=Ceratodon purpureus TaxID=3225 RepID=A0A8T0GJ51_CERPU|nr:hypothetical protein KC19_10G011500 [Ceratodon purpureus]KAG0602385.1 hypothetical protein M758_10G010800 [Ceratodon purpureus]